MYSRKILKTVCVLTCCVVFLGASLFAQQNSADTNRDMNKNMDRMKTDQPMEMSKGFEHDMAGKLVNAEKLIGIDVVSSLSAASRPLPSAVERPQASERMSKDQNKIGTVEELIIDSDKDAISYVVINANDKLYPVPWAAFDVKSSHLYSRETERVGVTREPVSETDTVTEVERDREIGRARPQDITLVLNISPDKLNQAPSIPSIDSEHFARPGLKNEVETFYSSNISGYRGKAMLDPGKSSEMKLGRTAETEKAREPGQMRTTEPEMASANLHKATDLIGLQVQGAQQDEIGDIQDLVIDTRRGNIAYGLVSFGGFLGVGGKTAAVPWSSLTMNIDRGFASLTATEDVLNKSVIDINNLDKLSEPQFAREIHQNFQAEPYWEVYGFVPGEEEQPMKWKDYDKKFDPANVTTIKGKIENVSTIEPEKGLGRVKLTIKTDDGRSVDVYAGPKDFASQQGIDFRTGSDITVKGASTMIDEKSIMLASEVTIEGKTLKLRDSEGKPQWKSEMREGAKEKLDTYRKSSEPSERTTNPSGTQRY